MKWLTNLSSRLWPTPTFDQPPLPQSTVTETITMSPTGTTPSSADPTTDHSGSASTIIAGTIRPLDVKPGEIYELSSSQYTRLHTAANREGMAFVVPYPAFSDQPQHAQDLLLLCQEFEDLLALGLVVDVSAHFQENVAEAWDEQGRHVRFMELSLLGKLMFQECEGVVN